MRSLQKYDCFFVRSGLVNRYECMPAHTTSRLNSIIASLFPNSTLPFVHVEILLEFIFIYFSLHSVVVGSSGEIFLIPEAYETCGNCWSSTTSILAPL
mmetsp:Transcript_11210/g.41974  ORF Transcript_11210/g.41974 Transcript_11210/m.41974 type:complete len:98 (-) Transcript_11210:198-491(-)